MLFLYYKRQAYTLQFNLNGSGATGAIAPVPNIKYGAPLASYKPSTSPSRPGYEFDDEFGGGWYWNAECQTPVDWDNAVMPLVAGSTVQVFAKWTPNAVRVNFNDGIGGSYLDYETTSMGGTVPDPAIPEYTVGNFVTGKGVFKGWIWLIEGHPVSFIPGSTPVNVDLLDVYATWEIPGLTITYNTGEGAWSGPALVDSHIYSINEYARIRDGSSYLTPPTGKVFYGWDAKDEDGNFDGILSYPYNLHIMTSSLELFAIYGDEGDSTKFIFHPVIADYSPPVLFSQWHPKSNVDMVPLAGQVYTHSGNYKRLIGWADAAPDGSISDDELEALIEDPADNGFYELNQPIIAGIEDVRNFYAVWVTPKMKVTFRADPGGHFALEDSSITSELVYNKIPYNSPWGDYFPDILPKGAFPTVLNGVIVEEAGWEFDGWSAAFPASDDKVYYDMVFVAKFKPTTKSITIKKIWDDDDDQWGNRPESVTLQLFANYESSNPDPPIGEYPLTKDNATDFNTWAYSVPNLPTHENGQEITYTVIEVDGPEGYLSSYRQVDEDGNPYVKNSFQTTSRGLWKIWEDEWEGEYNYFKNRPDAVEMEIWVVGDGDDRELVKTVSITKDDTEVYYPDNYWFIVVEDLPTYIGGVEVDGVVLKYEIVEKVPPGYTVDYGVPDPEQFIVTNYTKVHENMAIHKSWRDNNNSENTRPASIIVDLLANGIPVKNYPDGLLLQPITANPDADWSRLLPESDNLPTHIGGELADYTIKERAVPEGYTSFANGLTIINAKNLTVTFDPNGAGASVDPTRLTKQFGQQYGFMPTPTRPGYTFTNWYTGATGGTLINEDTIVTNINDHTLYANWTPIGDTPYTVEHILIRADGSIQRISEGYTGQTGALVRAIAHTYTGFVHDPNYTGTIANGYIAADGSLRLILYYLAVVPPPTPPVTPPTTTPTTPPATPVTTTTPPTPAEPPAELDLPPATTPTTPGTTPRPNTPGPSSGIGEPDSPQGSTIPEPSGTSAWALLNLILSILGALLTVIALLRFALTRKKEEQEEDGRIVIKRRPHARWWVIILAATVLAFIVFIITEDMRLPMAWVDWWTIVHIIIFIIQLALFVLALRRVKDKDEDQRQAQGQSAYVS